MELNFNARFSPNRFGMSTGIGSAEVDFGAKIYQSFEYVGFTNIVPPHKDCGEIIDLQGCFLN